MATKGTLKYKIYPKKDNRHPDEDEKFYARAAQHIKGVSLNVRNTKSWSNTELRKLCVITELNEYKAGAKPITDEGADEGETNE